MATTRIETADGVEIANHHLGGDGPPSILLHATGFHGRCWERLAERLTPDFSVWAPDQRGHGDSGKSPDSRYDDWDRFVDDLLTVIDNVGAQGWRGLGHSMGGAVLLMAEARRPGTFTSLCLYEPVVLTPEWAASVNDAPGRAPLAELARKRQASFPSRQAALDNYRSKPPFKEFDPAVLEAYVEHGFVEQPDGTVTLACAREDEASVFEGAPGSHSWSSLPDVSCPVTVLCGNDRTEPLGWIAQVVAQHLPRGRFRELEGLNHFGPMVDPDGVGRLASVALGVSTHL